jgi:hypothetical protein
MLQSETWSLSGGFTIGSRGEVPGERKLVTREQNDDDDDDDDKNPELQKNIYIQI